MFYDFMIAITTRPIAKIYTLYFFPATHAALKLKQNEKMRLHFVCHKTSIDLIYSFKSVGYLTESSARTAGKSDAGQAIQIAINNILEYLNVAIVAMIFYSRCVIYLLFLLWFYGNQLFEKKGSKICRCFQQESLHFTEQNIQYHPQHVFVTFNLI